MKRNFAESPYTTEEVNKVLINSNIVMLDNYKTGYAEVKFKCITCKHEWVGMYIKVKQYKCCPECRRKYVEPKFGTGLKPGIRHYIKKKARALLFIKKRGGVCEECKCDLIDANWKAEFHHIDPDKKDYNISSLLYHSDWDKIDNELSKCQLLCSSCHSKKHFDDNEKYNKYKEVIQEVMEKMESGEMA